ncbi:MAG: hypothetical protein WAZ98_14920 [Cyclobacteriaceae bacterium]
MKQRLFILLMLASLNIHAQKFLTPITIGIKRSVERNEVENSNKLSDKVATALSEAIDSLSGKYEFEFVNLAKNPEEHIDLLVDISLGYNNRTSISYGSLFKYKSEITFKDFETDSTVAKVELLYKDLENIPINTLMADDYGTYDKVFSKIAVPVHRVLNPLSDAPANCFCLAIGKVIDSKSGTSPEVAFKLTHILNNALAYHQKQYVFQYFDCYKAQSRNTETPKTCSLINGLLEQVNGRYVLQIKYGKGPVNLTHPRQVSTTFSFDPQRIADGDYYEAIWQLNKSVYSFLENNVPVR